jgi:hypothetical protein
MRQISIAQRFCSNRRRSKSFLTPSFWINGTVTGLSDGHVRGAEIDHHVSSAIGKTRGSQNEHSYLDAVPKISGLWSGPTRRR